MIAWAPAAAGSRTATRAAAAMNRPTECRFIWASLSIGCCSALQPELKRSWPDDRHRRDHPRQHGRLQEHQDADEAGEGDAVPEDVAQDLSLLALLAGGHAGHHDALGVDHLAHDAAAAVAGAGQDGAHPPLLGAGPVQVPEEDVRDRKST